MIVPQLHRQPQALDRQTHRQFGLSLPWSDWSIADGLNSVFIASAEFGDACRDFAIVFVKAGEAQPGVADYAPIAVFGLADAENLYVKDKRWRAAYEPMALRCYPFCIARIDADRAGMCIDMAWPGVNPGGQGQRLFDDQGQPTELTAGITRQLEDYEGEIDRTRRATRRLSELGLLREMRFDGTLPDGQKVVVDGFFVVDEPKVRALPDATVLELHRQGMFPLIHAHWFSLGHMKRLLQWRVERGATAASESTPEPKVKP